MKIHKIEIEIKNTKAVVSGQTTRQYLIDLFGEPDDIGGFSRKKKKGVILKYGNTEFHFKGDKSDDLLLLIYRERKVSGEYFPELSIVFNESSKDI